MSGANQDDVRVIYPNRSVTGIFAVIGLSFAAVGVLTAATLTPMLFLFAAPFTALGLYCAVDLAFPSTCIQLSSQGFTAYFLWLPHTVASWSETELFVPVFIPDGVGFNYATADSYQQKASWFWRLHVGYDAFIPWPVWDDLDAIAAELNAYRAKYGRQPAPMV